MGVIDFLGIKIDNFSLDEALDRVDEIVLAKKPGYYCGVNLNQVILYKENIRMKEIFDKADLLTVDGKPIIWISKLLGTPFNQKISGPDFMLETCKLANRKGYKVFFLGGAAGVAEKAVLKIKKICPDLEVSGIYSPPFGFEKDPQELDKINEMLKRSKADLLYVGLGSPKQDFFIDDNKDTYQIPLSFSVGIAIDYIGGNIKRAPLWMQNLGLEWFYRFCQEPKRLFKRYFIDSWKIIKYYKEFVQTPKNRYGKNT